MDLTYLDSYKSYALLKETVLKTPDDDLTSLYRDFLNACFKYANTRAEWELLTREQKIDRDPSRTMKHDAVIRSITILKRYMSKQGLSIMWADMITSDETDRAERKKVGDFACYVTLICGINNR